MIFRVAVENVTPLWPQVGPLVMQGMRGAPTHDDEDVRRMLMAQMSQLWVQWREPTVEAIVVSEFAAYPKGVWLRAWLAAALPEARMDDDGFLAALSEWARAHRCRGFEAGGRHGWLRRFSDAKVEGLRMRVTWP